MKRGFWIVKQIIDEQIEELRLKMHEIASDKNLTDHRVVSISCKLDVLINEFYSIRKLDLSSKYQRS